MIMGSPLASAQCQGASSTVTWTCPIRGDTARAFGPNTWTIRRFSVRYWMTTIPRASHSATGGSMTIFGAGSSPASGTTPGGPRTSLADCAKAPDDHRASASTTTEMPMVFIAKCSRTFIRPGPTFSAAIASRDYPGHVSCKGFGMGCLVATTSPFSRATAAPCCMFRSPIVTRHCRFDASRHLGRSVGVEMIGRWTRLRSAMLHMT